MDEPQMIHQPTDLTGHSLHLWTRNTYIGTVRVLESSLTVPEKLDLQNTRATSRHLGHWNFEHTHKIENVNIHSARIGISLIWCHITRKVSHLQFRRTCMTIHTECTWIYIQNKQCIGIYIYIWFGGCWPLPGCRTQDHLKTNSITSSCLSLL